MNDWLSTTQHKINAGIALALIVLLCLLAYAHFSRANADAAVLAASERAKRATAIDSTKQALIRPQIAKLERRVDSLSKVSTQLNLKTLLNAKRNENLNKQLDSVNGVLGIRPRF